MRSTSRSPGTRCSHAHVACCPLANDFLCHPSPLLSFFPLSLSSNCATSQKLCRNRYIRTLETLVHSRAHSQFFTNVFAVSRSLSTVVSLFRWSSQARNMFVPLRFPIARTAWSRTNVAISSQMRTFFLLFFVSFLAQLASATGTDLQFR